MSRTAQSIRKAVSPASVEHSKISLRLVDSGIRQTPHCLLYQVTLEGPRIRSSYTRRLRLKDSLAGGVASRKAAILARDAHFWDYLQQISLTTYEAEIDARRARHFINRVCAISSRHQLDRDDSSARRFFTLIEQPFLDWLLSMADD